MTKSTKQSKPRQKQIKLSHIQSKVKEINKMETYVLDEEQNLVIKYYPTFPENKIEELLKEINQIVVEAEEKGSDFFKDNSLFMKYLYLLILKKMTSLDSEIPEDFETQVYVMDQIIDIGLFRKVFDDILDGNEVLKVIGRVEEMVVNVAKITEATQKELAKLDRLENKEILNKPFNVLTSPSPTDVIQ